MKVAKLGIDKGVELLEMEKREARAAGRQMELKRREAEETEKAKAAKEAMKSMEEARRCQLLVEQSNAELVTRLHLLNSALATKRETREAETIKRKEEAAKELAEARSKAEAEAKAAEVKRAREEERQRFLTQKEERKREKQALEDSKKKKTSNLKSKPALAPVLEDAVLPLSSVRSSNLDALVPHQSVPRKDDGDDARSVADSRASTSAWSAAESSATQATCDVHVPPSAQHAKQRAAMRLNLDLDIEEDAATFNLLVRETIKYGAVQEGSQPSTIRRRHPSNGLVVVTLKSNGLIVTCWVDDGSRAWHTTQPCRFGTKCQRYDCVFMH